MLESLINKVAALKACNFIKKRLQHSFFFYKYCKIFKNTYFDEHLQTAASVILTAALYIECCASCCCTCCTSERSFVKYKFIQIIKGFTNHEV